MTNNFKKGKIESILLNIYFSVTIFYLMKHATEYQRRRDRFLLEEPTTIVVFIGSAYLDIVNMFYLHFMSTSYLRVVMNVYKSLTDWSYLHSTVDYPGICQIFNFPPKIIFLRLKYLRIPWISACFQQYFKFYAIASEIFIHIKKTHLFY